MLKQWDFVNLKTQERVRVMAIDGRNAWNTLAYMLQIDSFILESEGWEIRCVCPECNKTAGVTQFCSAECYEMHCGVRPRVEYRAPDLMAFQGTDTVAMAQLSDATRDVLASMFRSVQ